MTRRVLLAVLLVVAAIVVARVNHAIFPGFRR